MAGVLLAPPLLSACSGGMRAEDGSDQAAARGAGHVEKACIGCHPGPQLDAVVRQLVADTDAHVALDAFLVSHHAADPAPRAEIIAHLQARLDAAPGTE